MNLEPYQTWAAGLAELNPLTIRQYSYYLSHLPEPKQLTQEIINEIIINHRGARPALKSLKEYFTANGLNPGWAVPKTKGMSKQRNPKELTHEEIEAILQAITNPKHKIITTIMLASGLRISEVINLNRKNIDTETYTLKGLGKHNKEFRQTFSPKILPALQQYLQGCSEEYPFKLSRVTAYLFLNRAAKRAGLTHKISPHWFRHACCYHLIKDLGWNLEEAREFMRHKDISTTAHYSRASEQDVRNKFIEQEKEEV